jgi:hypothetical protein
MATEVIPFPVGGVTVSRVLPANQAIAIVADDPQAFITAEWDETSPEARTLGGSGYGVLSGGNMEAGTFEIRVKCPSAGQITISEPVLPLE